MASKDEIDAFLSAGREEPQAAPEPQPEPEPQPAKEAAAPEPDEDTEPEAAREGEPTIPRRAYEDERRKRQDWKEKAARYEGELTALRKQLEDAQRPRPEPQQQQRPEPQPMPDFATDPNGAAAAWAQRQQSMLLNERLNMSELMLRDKLGPETVDALVSEFKQAAEADPTLYGKLYQQPHPYNWMQREVERMRLMNEVSDPDAYRAKVRAEIEAELRAAAPPQTPPVSPAAGQPRSLAQVRSAAPRTAPAWTGERPLDAILADRRR